MFDGGFKSKRAVSVIAYPLDSTGVVYASRVLEPTQVVMGCCRAIPIAIQINESLNQIQTIHRSHSEAQLERIQREREKLRQKSATNIQAFVRGRWNIERERGILRGEWDAALVQNDKSDGGLLELTAKLAFIAGGIDIPSQEDMNRLSRWTSYLASDWNDGGFVWMVPLINSKEETRKAWLHVLPKLIILSIKSANSNDHQRNGQLLAFVIQVLQNTSNPRIESAHILPHVPKVLLDRNIIQLLQSLIESMPTNLPGPYAPFLIFTTLLQKAPPFASTLQQMTTIMTIPNLSDRMSSTSIIEFLSALPMENWIGYLKANFQVLFLESDQTSTQKKAYLLANLVVFWSQGGSSVKKASELSDMISVLRILIDGMPLGYFATVHRELLDDPEVDSDDSDNEDRKRVRRSAPSPSPMEGVVLQNSIDNLDTRTKLNLGVMVEGPFLTSLVDTVVAQARDNDFLIPDAVLLILTLLYHWPTKKSSILASVTYASKAKLVGAIVQGLKAGVVWTTAIGGERSGWGKYLYNPNLDGEWSSIVFLSEVLCHQLQIMSDSEFLALTEPVSTKDIVSFSSILRSVLFHVFWTASDFSKSKHLNKYNSHIVHTFTSLLEQIYSRDSRRQFCPPNHWQMTSEIEMESFIQQAIADSDPSTTTPTSPLRSITSSSPRQQVLTHIPYVIPFEVRVKIFRAWIKRDREASGLDSEWLRPVARVEIRRDHVFEDAYTKLNGLGEGLKNRVAITFVSSLDGEVEAGIDGFVVFCLTKVNSTNNDSGGVFKEFLSELLKEVFSDGKHGLFQSTPENLIYPQTNHHFDSLRLRYMEFFGRVIAKALYEGILIDAGFAGFFLSKWLGRQSYLDDLLTLDTELHQGLMFLKNYKGNVEQDLSLNFTATEEGREAGTQRTVELIPIGSKIPVTLENRIRYIYLMANYKLNVRIGVPCHAFFDGLSTLINAKWLKIFNQAELQMLLGGASVPIDLEDLKRNITYGGDFHELHPTIRLFWQVVESEDEFSEEDRRLLVKFVTSCARPPLLGFSELKPGFCIRPSGESEDRLRECLIMSS
ncbi:UNVERIFIED_CONTAM: hypothetical protein HDU68_010964 [Siphonaria sp. JEL0065]|nr:hypothetical protein HDU68_010964 [Siphonaria sp. JEL0065]